jgi:hypothetical protein
MSIHTLHVRKKGFNVLLLLLLPLKTTAARDTRETACSTVDGKKYVEKRGR